MRPPVAIHGGKSRQAAWIVRHLPPHTRFVEPFAGSAAVLFAKPRSRVELLNDADHAIMAFFEALRDQPTELERVCALTPYSRAEYRRCQEGLDEPGITVVERARRWFTVLSQGFGSIPAAGPGAWSSPGVWSEANKPARLQERFADCARRLSTVHFDCRPASEIIARNDRDGTVLYCDPPYLGTTRSWAHLQPTHRDYRVELSTEEEHDGLLKQLLDLKRARVVISGRDCPLYAEMLCTWRVVVGKQRERLWLSP